MQGAVSADDDDVALRLLREIVREVDSLARLFRFENAQSLTAGAEALERSPLQFAFFPFPRIGV